MEPKLSSDADHHKRRMRNGLSPRARFEVLKRDGFQCRYCGRNIVPLAAGGANDLDNLVTACQACNQGKASRLLQEGMVAGEDPAALLESKRARTAGRQELDALIQEELGRFNAHWGDLFGATKEGDRLVLTSGFPGEKAICRFLRHLCLADLIEAASIAEKRFPWNNSETKKYFYGICHSMMKQVRP